MVNTITTTADNNGNNGNGVVNEDLLEEEELVRQVLQENPPEEKGERDEWKQHVGWHRIENVRLAADSSITSGNNGSNSNGVINRDNTNFGRHGSIITENIRRRRPSLRGVNVDGDVSSKVGKTREVAQEVVNTVPLKISNIYNFLNPATPSTISIIVCAVVMILCCFSIRLFCRHFSPSSYNRKRKRWIDSNKRRTL